jgi:penicillin-binding protein 1A
MLRLLPSSLSPEVGGRLRRWIRRLAVAALALAVAGALGISLLIAYYSRDLPDVQHLRGGYNPPQVSRIYAADGTLLFSEFVQRRTVVAFDQISDVTKLAFLAAEDAHFYEHPGVRPLSLVRALWVNLRAGHKVQGGSTITQQVAEDVLLGHSRTYSQKVREWILAYRLEHELSKDEILGLYMNNITLGHGRYGVEEAARFYFGKSAAQLGAAEGALLAGIIASPERYSPRRAPQLALARRSYVLRQMRDKGFITPEYFAQLIDSPLELGPLDETQSSLAPEAVRFAREALAQARSEHRPRDGYEVDTTIDPRLQAAARNAVRSALSAYADRHDLWPPFRAPRVKAWGAPARGMPKAQRIYVGRVQAVDDAAGTLDVQVGDVVGQVELARELRYNPRGLAPSEFASVGAVLRVRLLDKIPARTAGHPEPGGEQPPRLRLELGPQAALVAIDVRSRQVVALVGSEEAAVGGFDRSTQAHRQPASSFKPLVYSAALHRRIVTPATILDLERAGPGTTLDGAPYRISVRSALAHSNNDAAVQLLERTGPAEVVEWAKQIGIQSRLLPDDSLALGAYEVTPLELANCYATFASGGWYREPSVLSAIRQRSDEAVVLPPRPEARRVMSAEEAYLVTSLLQTVVEEGTAEQARRLNRPIAAKTGTSNLVKDAWFAGYSTELSVAVWVGYDDALPLGPEETGARVAGPAFVDFMQAAHEGRPVSEFPRPDGIATVRVDPATGLLPWPGQTNAVPEEFLAGTEPEQQAAAPAGFAVPIR